MSRNRGFTLVEVLVALVLLAIMSGLAWRALDAMLRTREITQASIERSAALQTALAQWEQDLAQLQELPKTVGPLAFDGQSLRFTRRHEQGIQVVVWRVADGQWSRWASAPVLGLAALREAWQRSEQPALQRDVLPVLQGLQGWQIAYYWDNAWANAGSTGDGGQRGEQRVPRGIRVQLEFTPDSGWGGPLTRSLMLVGGSSNP